MNTTIRSLESRDVPVIAAAFADAGWRGKPLSLYERYLGEQGRGERAVLVAFSDDVFSGYLTIRWHPDYPPFAEMGIPEVQDLNVLAAFQRGRIASALMDEAERLIFERSPAAGIGVGMYADYGPAQRMYARRGYVPDGNGLFHRQQPIVAGRSVPVDDHLVLYLTKER